MNNFIGWLKGVGVVLVGIMLITLCGWLYVCHRWIFTGLVGGGFIAAVGYEIGELRGWIK